MYVSLFAFFTLQAVKGYRKRKHNSYIGEKFRFMFFFPGFSKWKLDFIWQLQNAYRLLWILAYNSANQAFDIDNIDIWDFSFHDNSLDQTFSRKKYVH